MRKYRWDIDDQTVVEARYSLFLGKEQIFVNNQLINTKRNLGIKGRTEFKIDYRHAVINVAALGFSHDVELTVNDKLYIHDQSGIQKSCTSCQTPAKVNDSFCQSCGTVLPETSSLLRTEKVNQAGQTILILSVVFLIFGIAMFFIQKGQLDQALTNLASYKAEDIWPNQINGKTYTVHELRTQIQFEKYGILGLNIFLAVIMFGLSRWSKSSPLPAIIVAASIYLAVNVLNAVLDPTTIAQGMIMKIFFISMFYKGIKSALEARPKPAYAKA